MTGPNVRINGTCVTHAKAINQGAVTLCGASYDRVPASWSDPRLLGVETEDPVDCMTCLVKDPGEAGTGYVDTLQGRRRSFR